MWPSGIIFLFIFACDLLSVCPTIYWRDAPEFIDVAYNWGIPHPAGSPTYILLAKLFSFIPFGSIALRINLVSSVFHGLCGVLLFHLIDDLVAFLFPKVGSINRRFGALLGTLSFCLSPAFWSVASFSEVYTMNAFFILLLMWLSLGALRKKDIRYVYAGAFCYGLSAGVHATVAFYLPAVFLLFAFVTPTDARWRDFCRICFFFLLGFSTYLYLPIRSVANPAFDWGNPQTLSQFIIHVTDRKTQSQHLTYEAGSFLQKNLDRYWGHLGREIGWLGLAACALGMLMHLKREKKYFSILILFLIGNLLFFLNWKTGDGIIPSNLVLTAWSGIGFAVFLSWISNHFETRGSRRVRPDRILMSVLLIFVLYRAFVPLTPSGVSPYLFADKSGFYNAYDTARREMDKMNTDAMAVTTLFWFPFRYLQDVEGHRPDLSILMASDVLAPKYFNTITQSRFPKLEIPEVDPYQTAWYDYMPQLINLNVGHRAVYYEPNLTLVPPIHKNLLPESYLFKVVPGPQHEGLDAKVLSDYLEGLRSFLHEDLRDPEFLQDPNAREYNMSFLLFSADYLIQQGHDTQAEGLLRLALEIFPGQGTVEYYLAQTELNLGKIYQGLNRLHDLARMEPYYPDPYLLLARHALGVGDLQSAGIYLENARKFLHENFQAEIIEVEFFWRTSDIVSARRHLDQAMNLVRMDQDQQIVNQWKIILNEAS